MCVWGGGGGRGGEGEACKMRGERKGGGKVHVCVVDNHGTILECSKSHDDN